MSDITYTSIHTDVSQCMQSMCTYFNDRADARRYEDKQAGLLIKQIEENHYGAETSPQHWKTKRTNTTCYTVFA